LLLTLPILLWSLLMFSRTMIQPGRAVKLAAVVTLFFMVALFFQMMRTLETHRWRRYFFVAWVSCFRSDSSGSCLPCAVP
jgi:hypothetical protein